MTENVRLYRSALYVPGSKTRALEKARTLPTDAILFDLEDAVAPDEKAGARKDLRAVLDDGGFGQTARIVRINALDTPWGADDASAVADAEIDGVLIPKVGSPADLDAVGDRVGDLPLWAMIETPAGVLAAASIAAHPRLAGFVLGTNDLLKDLGARTGPDRQALLPALGLALLAARAHRRICIDGVFNAFTDEAGLRAECIQGRDLGFDGKSLIHPAQIDVANEVFAPAPEEVELAKRQIAAFETAQADGQGVAVVDGRIVENLHVATAREILAKNEAIAAREG